MATGMTRIEVQLPDRASARRHRELGAFVRYCVLRIERELGARERWSVTIARAAGAGFASSIAVRQAGVVLEETGTGHDDAAATWDAMCRIEQRLRERRASDAGGAR